MAISSGISAEWWSEPEFEARFPLLPADVLPRMWARIRVVDKHQVQRSGPVYRWSDLLHALQAEAHDLDKTGQRTRAEEIAKWDRSWRDDSVSRSYRLRTCYWGGCSRYTRRSSRCSVATARTAAAIALIPLGRRENRDERAISTPG